MHNYTSQQYLFTLTYTATCFDIYMSSSGNFTFVPRYVHSVHVRPPN